MTDHDTATHVDPETTVRLERHTMKELRTAVAETLDAKSPNGFGVVRITKEDGKRVAYVTPATGGEE